MVLANASSSFALTGRGVTFSAEVYTVTGGNVTTTKLSDKTITTAAATAYSIPESKIAIVLDGSSGNLFVINTVTETSLYTLIELTGSNTSTVHNTAYTTSYFTCSATFNLPEATLEGSVFGGGKLHDFTDTNILYIFTGGSGIFAMHGTAAMTPTSKTYTFQ